MSFKIVFPTGYQINDKINDNIDINVILSNGDVYFATLFTLSNIQYLMGKDRHNFFWADSMLIVESLDKNSIREAISEMISEGYFNNALSKIGNIDSIYGRSNTYSELIDMSRTR